MRFALSARFSSRSSVLWRVTVTTGSSARGQKSPSLAAKVYSSSSSACKSVSRLATRQRWPSMRWSQTLCISWPCSRGSSWRQTWSKCESTPTRWSFTLTILCSWSSPRPTIPASIVAPLSASKRNTSLIYCWSLNSFWRSTSMVWTLSVKTYWSAQNPLITHCEFSRTTATGRMTSLKKTKSGISSSSWPAASRTRILGLRPAATASPKSHCIRSMGRCSEPNWAMTGRKTRTPIWFRKWSCWACCIASGSKSMASLLSAAGTRKWASWWRILRTRISRRWTWRHTAMTHSCLSASWRLRIRPRQSCGWVLHRKRLCPVFWTHA